jgi:Astacin (Peptidase family M12A)
MATSIQRLCFVTLLFAVQPVSAADSDPAHMDAHSEKLLPWPGGIIPYDISKLTETQQTTAKGAMKRWMDTGANITFIPHTTEIEYVNFTGQVDAGNNTSLVGYKKGTRADINITAFWWRQGDWMPAHELGHVLGFFHEHSRWDRDKYVTIHYENIKEGRQSDYDWVPKTNWIVSSTAYDYRSIMHYRTCWASKCESECKDGDGSTPCVVIDPIGKDYDKVIGQWGDNGISTTDAEKVRLVYGTKPQANSKLTKQDK